MVTATYPLPNPPVCGLGRQAIRVARLIVVPVTLHVHPPAEKDRPHPSSELITCSPPPLDPRQTKPKPPLAQHKNKRGAGAPERGEGSAARDGGGGAGGQRGIDNGGGGRGGGGGHELSASDGMDAASNGGGPAMSLNFGYPMGYAGGAGGLGGYAMAGNPSAYGLPDFAAFQHVSGCGVGWRGTAYLLVASLCVICCCRCPPVLSRNTMYLDK